MWDSFSALIGIFIGFFLAILIVGIGYQTRIFLFTGCPRQEVRCRPSNYFKDPGDALKNGSNINSILFQNTDSEIIYHQVPKDPCRPGPEQDVVMDYPQYCVFTDNHGHNYEAKNTTFQSPYYTTTSKVNGSYVDIVSGKQCKPQNNDGNLILVKGTPELKWDSN